MTRALGVNLKQRIGKTPLLRLKSVTREMNDVQVLGKAEWTNPGGSVKDRAASNIIEEALRDGRLAGGKTLLDATSGNTGIAYAMLGAACGIPVTLCVPLNVSTERKRILSAFGAKVIYTDPGEGSDGAIVLCRKIIDADPDRYFKPDQYNNEANPLAHFETTGPEIWRQTEGAVTHFVAGIGTSGTIMGTGRFLKSRNPGVKVIAVEPDDPMHGLEGLKHMASSIIPGIYHERELDDKMQVSTEDAYEMVYALGQFEGLLVGQSSGAAMVAALKLASSLREGTVVTIFSDFGEKYLSTNLWIGWQEWRREHLQRLIRKWNVSANVTT